MVAFGRHLARHVRIGDVIALEGGLGAGKTTLARGLLEALGLQGEAPSPSFAIVQPYDVPEVRVPVTHVDLYRLEDPADVVELGWEETMDGLALIEWPGKAGENLPEWRLDLTLEQTVDGRTARLEPRGEDWQARLHGI